jgi:predicted ATPase
LSAKNASPAVADAFTRARQLCQQLDQPSQLAMLLVGQVQYHFMAGEQELACQESKEILDLGEARKDTDIKFQGCAMSAATWFHVGDFSGARSYAERALTLYDPRHPSLAWWPQDPYATVLAFSARSLAYLGFFDQARARHEEALERARQRSHPHTIALVHGIWAPINERLGCDPEILLRESDESLAYAADHGFTWWVAASLANRGSRLLALGRVQEALNDITDGLAKLQATGALTTIPAYRTSLAQALGKAGRPTAGLAQLDEAERQIEATQERWTEADMHHVRGELLVCLGDLPLAEQSLQRAISVARSQTAKLYEVRAAASLARLWRDKGKRLEARDLLAATYNSFTEGFDTRVLRETNVLLQQLAG